MLTSGGHLTGLATFAAEDRLGHRIIHMMLVYLLLRNTRWLDYTVSRAAPRSFFVSNRAAIIARCLVQKFNRLHAKVYIDEPFGPFSNVQASTWHRGIAVPSTKRRAANYADSQLNLNL